MLPIVKNTHIICMYKYPMSDMLYKADLVARNTCDEYDEQINTQSPVAVREKYYLCFERGDAHDAYKILTDYLERFKYGKNGFYKLHDFKKHFYDIIEYLDTQYQFVIINHINDRRDTLRLEFIKRLHSINIHDLPEYLEHVKDHSLDLPENPFIFFNFDWIRAYPKSENTYGLKRATQEIKKMAQDPQIFEKIKKIGSDYYQLKAICRMNRKIPFTPHLYDVCNESFPMRR